MILSEGEAHKLEAFEENGSAIIQMTWFEWKSIPEKVIKIHVNKPNLLKILAMMEGEGFEIDDEL